MIVEDVRSWKPWDRLELLVEAVDDYSMPPFSTQDAGRFVYLLDHSNKEPIASLSSIHLRNEVSESFTRDALQAYREDGHSRCNIFLLTLRGFKETAPLHFMRTPTAQARNI